MQRCFHTVGILLIAAIVVQIGICAFDNCGQNLSDPAVAGHCHDCICTGAAVEHQPTLTPPEHFALATVEVPRVLVDAPLNEPFLPPRG